NGSVDEFHNGLSQGYVQLSMRCDSPFSYSPVYVSDIYDFSVNIEEGSNIQFENYGDGICKPIITLEKHGDGDVSIINLTEGGRELKLINILDGEVLTIDCDNEQIEAEIGDFNYENHNNIYLRFVPHSLNRLK